MKNYFLVWYWSEVTAEVRIGIAKSKEEAMLELFLISFSQEDELRAWQNRTADFNVKNGRQVNFMPLNRLEDVK